VGQRRPHALGAFDRRLEVRLQGRGPQVTRQRVLEVLTQQVLVASDAFEQVLLFAILVTLAVLVFWSLIASRAIVAPVRALVAATRRVASGDLAVSVPARGGPELGELAAAFNQMASELAQGREKLVALKREEAWAEMARQVAHEVKNPLQPMRMAAQLLQRAQLARLDDELGARDVEFRLGLLLLGAQAPLVPAQAVLERARELPHRAGARRLVAAVLQALCHRGQPLVEHRNLGNRLRQLAAGVALQLRTKSQQGRESEPEASHATCIGRGMGGC